MAAPQVGTGRILGAANATSASKFISLHYDANTVTQELFVAPVSLLVTAIAGVPRVAGSGGACTFKFYKCADTVAVASGTILHAGSYNVAGSAEANQYLTLVGNQDSLTLSPGDRLGVELTGTPTSAVGAITITLEPVA